MVKESSLQTELHPNAIRMIDTMSKWHRPLTADDDLDFWKVAMTFVMRAASYIMEEQPSERDFFIQTKHWI